MALRGTPGAGCLPGGWLAVGCTVNATIDKCGVPVHCSRAPECARAWIRRCFLTCALHLVSWQQDVDKDALLKKKAEKPDFRKLQREQAIRCVPSATC